MPTDNSIEIVIESTDLPSCGELEIVMMKGREAISELFDFWLTVRRQGTVGLDFDALVGAGLTLVISNKTSAGSVEQRRISGIVTEAEDLLETESLFRTYKLRFRPRLAKLSLVRTQQVFLDQTVPQIIQQKLDPMGLGSDVNMVLGETYPARELVIQFDETDLDFIRRIAEHVGISFYFETCDPGRLILCDQPSGFTELERDTLQFRGRGEFDSVYGLVAKRQQKPDGCVVEDFNYRDPLTPVTGSSPVGSSYGGFFVEYGGHSTTPAEAQRLAEMRAEEQYFRELLYSGESSMANLAAGHSFTLEGHTLTGDLEFLVTEIEHEYSARVNSDKPGQEVNYRNTFVAGLCDRTFRPARVTPRPRIAGLYSGIIEDVSGQSASLYAKIDDKGRYWVRLLFDTAHSGTDRPSPPIRMLQNSSGANYGTHFPLRPGIEVMVGFVNGDPDRPIIVGAAANEITGSPSYTAPSADKGVLNRIVTTTGIQINMKDA